MSDDAQLLDRYARARDEAAFAELVRRHVNLVYSAAARRVGDRHLAEDVTQAVFMILARKARSARATTPLSAWLLTTVRYAAANALKIEHRRHHHESAAALQSGTDSTAASANPSDVLIWHGLAGHLDDALLKLSALDRQAVLLRYFEAKPVREIARTMNTTEGAAKQRLSRSLDKLRHRLARHATAIGVDGGAGLAALLATHAVRAAPTRLIASTCAVAATTTATGTASFTIAKGAIAMMTITKLKAVTAVVAVASLLTPGVFVTINRGAHAPGFPEGGSGQRRRPTSGICGGPRSSRARAAGDTGPTRARRRPDVYGLLRPQIDDAAPSRRRTDRCRRRAHSTSPRRRAVRAAVPRYGWDSSETSGQRRHSRQHRARRLADAEYLLAKLRDMP